MKQKFITIRYTLSEDEYTTRIDVNNISDYYYTFNERSQTVCFFIILNSTRQLTSFPITKQFKSKIAEWEKIFKILDVL